MVHVKIAIIGNIDPEFDVIRVKKWKSCLFSVNKKIDHFMSNLIPDLPLYSYSDDNLQRNLPSIEKLSSYGDKQESIDIVLYVMDVPIEGNWFSRILDKNRVVITYYQAKKWLKEEKIPLENYLIEHIYSYSLLFLQKGGKELSMDDEKEMNHDARRGCIFDKNGIKVDVIDSCISPIICSECKGKMLKKDIPESLIQCVEQELKKLKRSSYYSFILFLKKHPIFSLILSAISAVILGLLANIIFSYLTLNIL